MVFRKSSFSKSVPKRDKCLIRVPELYIKNNEDNLCDSLKNTVGSRKLAQNDQFSELQSKSVTFKKIILELPGSVFRN